MRRLSITLLTVGLLIGTIGTATAKPKADWNLAPVALAHLVERLELLNGATCTVEIGGSGTITRVGDSLEVTIHCER